MGVARSPAKDRGSTPTKPFARTPRLGAAPAPTGDTDTDSDISYTSSSSAPEDDGMALEVDVDVDSDVETGAPLRTDGDTGLGSRFFGTGCMLTAAAVLKALAPPDRACVEACSVSVLIAAGKLSTAAGLHSATLHPSSPALRDATLVNDFIAYTGFSSRRFDAPPPPSTSAAHVHPLWRDGYRRAISLFTLACERALQASS